jgi:hypothetical protein
MLIRIALIALGLIVTCLTQTIEVFGQASTPAGTMTGCLTRSGSPGFYLLQEEKTGLSTTVAASDDLQKDDLEKYSTGSKVKLTGRLIREEGRDVFRVTIVEQLSATCETTTVHVSVESIKDAVGRATFGVRGGLGLDPELPFLGLHAQLGPIIKGLWFRPSYEFGFGEVTKINSFNFDFAFYPDLTLRGKGMSQADFWNVYFGVGGAYHLSHRNFEEASVNIDFGDWEANGGLNIFMGMSKRSGLFTELRAVAYSSTSPTIKFIVGYTFR